MAAMKPKKASGENIEEWQRRTEAVKLRLPAAVAATVRERAAAKEMTLSGYVAELVARDATMRCEKCGDPPGGPDFCVGARYGSNPKHSFRPHGSDEKEEGPRNDYDYADFLHYAPEPVPTNATSCNRQWTCPIHGAFLREETACDVYGCEFNPTFQRSDSATKGKQK